MGFPNFVFIQGVDPSNFGNFTTAMFVPASYAGLCGYQLLSELLVCGF
jgi:hypothetical protein